MILPHVVFWNHQFIERTQILIVLHDFARHSGSHWYFNFLTRVLDGFFEFRILGVDEIDSTQFSCIVKMNLFFRPFLLFLQLGVLSH